MKTSTAAPIRPFVQLSPEAAQDFTDRVDMLELFNQLSHENKRVVIGFCRGELRDQQKAERDRFRKNNQHPIR